jgi:predicted transcriptional regulator
MQLLLLAVKCYSIIAKTQSTKWDSMRDDSHRRSRIEVICDILNEALSGANKTRLMYQCNLNFMRFNRYLQELLDADLIETVGSNPKGIVLYRTSDKGRDRVMVLRRANEFIST